MSVTAEDVQKIAHLARLGLSDAEMSSFTHDLNKILSLVEEMNQADTTHVEPMAHPHHASQALREDIVTETDQREALQANAPQTQDGLYLVPQVIE